MAKMKYADKEFETPERTTDFIPMEFKGKSYKVKKYSTWAEEQLINKYGEEKLMALFLSPHPDIIMSEVVHLLADDTFKADYPALDDLKKSMQDLQDKFDIVSTAWKLIQPALSVHKTPEEIEETNLNKKKLPKKWSIGNFWNYLFTRSEKHTAG